jgi:hypothetical protein
LNGENHLISGKGIVQTRETLSIRGKISVTIHKSRNCHNCFLFIDKVSTKTERKLDRKVEDAENFTYE